MLPTRTVVSRACIRVLCAGRTERGPRRAGEGDLPGRLQPRGPGAVDRAERVGGARVAGEVDAPGHGPVEDGAAMREARPRGRVRAPRPRIACPGRGRAAPDAPAERGAEESHEL